MEAGKRMRMRGDIKVVELWLDFAVLGGQLAVLLVLGVRLWRWE